MANLVISDVCNLDCCYCFAREHMQVVKESLLPAFISLEDFEERLDLLDRLGIGEARLIGGEPTLHPHFPSWSALPASAASASRSSRTACSPNKALECLAALPVEECSVLVNMNAVGRQPESEQRAPAGGAAGSSGCAPCWATTSTGWISTPVSCHC